MHIRQPIAIGTDATNGEPIVIPLSALNQGIYLNGPPGTGKTYQMLQVLSQTIDQGNRYLLSGDRGASLIAFDLKADDYLTFHVLRNAARRAGIPFKYFTNLTDRLPTFAFNPLDSAHMRTLDPQGKAEFICGATGLLYGREYGRGHFSSVGARIIAFGFEKYPAVRTFRELSRLLNTVLNGPARIYKHEMNPEFAKSGIHALTVLGRLARLDALNITSRGNHPKLISDKMLDLSDVFRTPHVCLFHLNSTREMYSSGDVGLLAAFEAIHSAASIPPGERIQTYLAIDEFSKLAHSNFSHILEQSRSMNISTILANQSLASLQQNGVNLLDAVMTDQRIRWWMAFTNPDEQKWFSERAGERLVTWEDISVRDTGEQTTNFRNVILPLYPVNLIKMAANDEDLSIFELTRRSSNLDLGGFPLLVKRLRLRDIKQWKQYETTPWPKHEPGTFVPKTRHPTADPAYVALAGELEDIFQDAEASGDVPPRPDAN